MLAGKVCYLLAVIVMSFISITSIKSSLISFRIHTASPDMCVSIRKFLMLQLGPSTERLETCFAALSLFNTPKFKVCVKKKKKKKKREREAGEKVYLYTSMSLPCKTKPSIHH